MSKGAKIAIGVSLGFLLFIGSVIGFIVSSKFTGEKFEASILAQNESMENTWGQVQGELEMAGFTVKNYGDTFIKSLEANAKRYENDKGSMMKWVQEASSQMSPETHKNFMNIISKSYAKKEARQLSKISKVQEYRTWRKASLKGVVGVAIFNFPSEKVEKIENMIISTKSTKETFKTGMEETKNPFSSSK
jgi:hypothetical protein